MLLTQGDPTGLSSTLGQLVIAASMLVVIVLCVRFFWDNRKR